MEKNLQKPVSNNASVDELQQAGAAKLEISNLVYLNKSIYLPYSGINKWRKTLR